MQRTVIVGDVHGMLAALLELLAQLRLMAGDRLIFVGDLVDKGPEPAGVVHHLASLAATAPYDIVLVDGNHEDRHRRYQRNLVERPVIAAQQAAEAPELPTLAAELTEAGRAFLNTAVPFYRLRAHNLLIVHGGIPGDMRRFPAGFVGLGQEKPGDPFWADVYDGRFGHVVFGHQPFLDGPAEFAHATGIDTGAVHGGALTALVLPDRGRRSYSQVRTPVFVPRR